MNESFGKLIEPQPVPFSFGAPGWYVVAGLIVLGLIFLGWLTYKNYKRNAYRRAALKYLSEVEKRFQAAADDSALLYEHNMMMKRVAMTAFARHQTASLRSNEWLAFLNNTLRKDLFAMDDMMMLDTVLYQSASHDPVSVKKFLSNSRTWIRNHKRTLKHKANGAGNAL